jgi:hypothetical protein
LAPEEYFSFNTHLLSRAAPDRLADNVCWVLDMMLVVTTSIAGCLLHGSELRPMLLAGP